MKTVLVLLGLVALALGETTVKLDMVKVDPVFVEKQKKVLSLVELVHQVSTEAEYYKIGHEYDVAANVENYTNKQAVKEFLNYWEAGMVPKNKVFSVFYEEMRQEAISLFHLFYYAKDFETFYKTACFARVHLNSWQFLYSFYIAVIQRPDCQGIVLPAPYETYPELFLNMEVISKFNFIKEQEDIFFPEVFKNYGMMKEDNKFVVYANYSNSFVFNNEEQRLAYFTEDVGLNAYYYWFHNQLPFWWNGDKFGPFKERRGEIYYFFYKQLLNRYYFERMTNGLGPIPEFSWFYPIQTGYYPLLAAEFTPFVQRPDHYNVNVEDNFEKVLYLDSFEKSFLQFLETGHFKAYNQEIDFHDPKALNFVGNFWQFNADLFHENYTRKYQRSYEATARQILSAAPHPVDKYTFWPSALNFYQTSLRDPAFYQLYDRIVDYMIQFKKYLKPYKNEELKYPGLKIEEVKVDKLVTYFDMYEFNATNAVYFNNEHLKHYPYSFVVRQPRLNHQHFSVWFDVNAEKAAKVVFKVFLGPKYDSNGFPIAFEDNWSKFLLLDYFVYEVQAGKNEIKRDCDEFYFFRQDSIPASEVWKLLDQGVVPKDMSFEFDAMPMRLMLPKGTKDGYPFQLFVFAYPHEEIPKEYEPFEEYVLDNKPFSYPFDKPIGAEWMMQPNMYFKDVSIYHEGEMFPYKYNIFNDYAHPKANAVPK